MADEVQLGSTTFCQSEVLNGVMLKLSVSFTSQETEGSVSMLSFFFCGFFGVAFFLAAETLEAFPQCSKMSMSCFERMVCVSQR